MMRLLKTGVIVFAVVFISLALFFSCDDGTKAVDPTAEDIAKFVEVMQVFVPFMGPEPPCVDMSYGEDTVTLTFTNCESDGVIINGSITLTVSGDPYSQLSITFNGTLNLSGAGAPVSSIAFNFTLTVDMSAYPSYSFAMSGTITIDGTVFNASGFLNEFVDYYW